MVQRPFSMLTDYNKSEYESALPMFSFFISHVENIVLYSLGHYITSVIWSHKLKVVLSGSIKNPNKIVKLAK